MPAQVFSEDLKPTTDFLLFFPLKPHVWSCPTVPGRFGYLSWSVRTCRTVSTGARAPHSLCEACSPFLFGSPWYFQMHHLPLC